MTMVWNNYQSRARLSAGIAHLLEIGDQSRTGQTPSKPFLRFLGPIALEYSAFAVDGRPDLGMIVYNPVMTADADRIRALIALKPAVR